MSFSKIGLMLGIAFAILLAILLAPQEAKLSMITPYVNEADIADINEAYSETANAPWYYSSPHPGIDFFPVAGTPYMPSTTPFQAVSKGVVQDVTLGQNAQTNNWQVSVAIKLSDEFDAYYTFEPMTTHSNEGVKQFKQIKVTQGDTVTSGQLIGYLNSTNDGAHVDFSLKRNDQFTCPEPYFNPAARDSIMRILRDTFQDVQDLQMCYF